ncbi:response regulator [Pelomonas puraquae]|nr:response regulator [Roseateles puraquae]
MAGLHEPGHARDPCRSSAAGALGRVLRGHRRLDAQRRRLTRAQRRCEVGFARRFCNGCWRRAGVQLACRPMNATAEFPHVLVVDDNLDAAEVLALLIETEGFTASVARNLATAREALQTHRPSIVLLDLNLPDGNGMALLSEVKADARTAGVQVVVLSGMLDDKVMTQARELGACAFLVKPFEHEQLSQVLSLAQAAS